MAAQLPLALGRGVALGFAFALDAAASAGVKPVTMSMELDAAKSATLVSLCRKSRAIIPISESF